MLISGGKNARKKPKVEIRDVSGNKTSLKKLKVAHKEEILKESISKREILLRGLLTKSKIEKAVREGILKEIVFDKRVYFNGQELMDYVKRTMGLGSEVIDTKKQPRKYTLADVIKKYTFSDFLDEQESLRINENIGVIDEHLSDLCDHLGRLLTEEETNDILDIVDEYTPKDKNGDYLGPLLPFDYAWEIYQIKKEQA